MDINAFDNYDVEHLNLSGILFISVDEDLHSFKFADSIKIKIVFDKKVLSEKTDRMLTELFERPVESEPDTMTRDSFEDENSMTDDTCVKNSDFDIKENANRSEDSSISVQHEKEEANDNETVLLNLKTGKGITKVPIFKRKISAKKKLKTAIVKLTPLVNPSVETSDLQGKKVSKSHQAKKDEPDRKVTNTKVRKEEVEKNICCRYCSKCFTSQKGYALHLKAERKSYRCRICHRNLRFKAELMIHLGDKYNETDKEIDAASCDLQSAKQKRIKKPQSCEAELKTKKDLKCHICGVVVSCVWNLKKHTLLHTGEYHYKCCVCGEGVRASSSLRKHLEKHLKPEAVECKICKVKFSGRTEFARHRRLTHAHQCGLCGEEFPNRTVLNFHHKTHHKDEVSKLRCPKCDRLYSCEKTLATHLLYHRFRKPTQCPICGIFVISLNKHMSNQHSTKSSNSSTYVCDKCSKQFKAKAALMRHLESHSEEKRYSCIVCSKHFACSGQLSRHMRIHMEEKPYVCEVCGKSCKQAGNLKIHMRTHIKSVKDLPCCHCGLNFPTKEDLQEHITMVHTREGDKRGLSMENFSMNQMFYQ